MLKDVKNIPKSEIIFFTRVTGKLKVHADKDSRDLKFFSSFFLFININLFFRS